MLGSFLKGKELREYQAEIDEAIERKAELESKYHERRGNLPGALKKLTNGYEMRTYWFDIFECGRKMALVALPIFLPADSPEQLTLGLIICFVTFGTYMMYAPFIDDGDDFLSQICQMQIFFSLLSSIILQTDPNSPVMAVLLPILIAVPPVSGFIFESGVLDELKKITSPDDTGWPIPFTGGKRVGVGCRSRTTACLERLLGVKKAPEEPDEFLYVAESTTASAADVHSTTAVPSKAKASEAEASEIEATSGAGDAEVDIPEHLKAMFAHFDRNKNGVFEYRELRNALNVAASLIQRYDDTPDGKMQLSEFATLVTQLEQGFMRSALTPIEVEPPLPEGWLAEQTADGKTYYYFNKATKQTLWRRPAAAEVDQPPLPTGWAAHQTPTGRTYYYHSASKTTTWKRPSGEDMAAQAGVPAPSRGGSETERTDRTHSDRTGPGKAALAKPLGLKWVSVGATAPADGTEVINAKLSFALGRKTAFTAAELSLYEMPKLDPRSYIKSGSSYFQPDATTSGGSCAAVPEAGMATGPLATPFKDGEGPGRATMASMFPSSQASPEVGPYNMEA